MMRGPTSQQVTIAIAGPPIGAGRVSATPAFHPRPMSRTITDGFPGRAEGSDAEAALMP
jgi:hypothetical protein